MSSDHGVDPAARRDRQEAGEAPRVEVAVGGRREQREVDVGGQHLRAAALHAAGDHATPRENGPHGAVWHRGDEVARRRHRAGALEAAGQRRAPGAATGVREHAAAVDGHDAGGDQRWVAEHVEIDL